jgi:wyosine [tRNA(Phe)-imidazoG37] synthetase (radical SAM superfamily)
MSIQPQTFYQPCDISDAVAQKLNKLKKSDEKVDYLTIVPDGEPTLDENLEETVRLLKQFDIPLAIITNGTQLKHYEVVDVLNQIDLVSVKVDAGFEESWRKVDRPLKGIEFQSHLKGIRDFAIQFPGMLITESMLIRDMNTAKEELEQMATFIAKLDPATAYISVPTRPTAIAEALPPTDDQLNMAYQIYSAAGLTTELLTGYESNEFSSTGNLHDDILAITAVHPMREDALFQFISTNNGDSSLVNTMLKQDELRCSEFNGRRFYTRKLKKIGA